MGTVASWSLTRIAPEKWSRTTVGDVAEHKVMRVLPDCDAMEALRLLLSERTHSVLLVTSVSGKLEGIVTKTDILEAFKARGEDVLEPAPEMA